MTIQIERLAIGPLASDPGGGGARQRQAEAKRSPKAGG